MASIVADRRARCGGRSGIDVGTRPWYVQRESPNPGTLLAHWTRAPQRALLAEAAIPDEIPSQPPLPGQTAPVLGSLATFVSGLRGYGFGGARIADLASLPGICRPGELAFYGIDLELNRKYGAPNPGAAGFVRRHTASMAPWTEACARGCHDVGLLSCADSKDAIHDGFALAAHLAGLGLRPVLVGCDHTASLVNVLGLFQKTGRPVNYLVLDAHLDLGLHHPSPDLHNGNFVDFLRLADGILEVVNVGVRSWISHAPIYQGLEGFAALAGGLEGLPLEDMMDRLDRLRDQPLYVSIDADVVDPAHVPNVPCPEPFGMTPEVLFRLSAWLGETFEVVGADLCEILPVERSLGAEQALMRCLHALFPRL